MADIELVIKIDKDYYEIIKHGVEHGSDYKPWSLIAHGTPLPKGHGDLKDIETFKLTYGNDGAYFRYKDIILAPTIIEADKESEETETWNGIHARITAPKGTFERIWNEAERGEE